MKKIITLIKKKYKILIPIMVIFVLLISMYFLYKEYKYDNYRNKQEEQVYQYFGSTKYEYDAIITYNLKKVIVDIASTKGPINHNSVPIYIKDKDKVIFPKEIVIAFPLKGGSQYKLYDFSVYEKIKNDNMITTGTDTSKYDFFFLFDGEEVYFFPEPVTLNIDDKEYTRLGSMSFIKIVDGNTLSYYDKENDKSESLEIGGKKITVSSEDINVNLSEQSFQSLGSKILLASPSYLNTIK